MNIIDFLILEECLRKLFIEIKCKTLFKYLS